MALVKGLVAGSTLLILGTTALAVPAASAAQTPANAQLIAVTGSSLSAVTAASTGFAASLSPAFSPTTYNYVLDCPTGTSSVTFTLTAASGTITVNGHTGPTETATVGLTTNQAAVVQAPSSTSPTTPTQYWIRCLPPGFPALKVVTDTGTTPNGYYLTQTTLVAPGGNPYVMILDNHATPVWWQKTAMGPGWFDLWSPGTLAWDASSNGGSPNFNDAAGFTTYNLATGATASVVPNHAPADGHEIVHLADGNTIFLTDPEVTGVNLTSIGKGTNQNVVDCGLQEVDPAGQIVWSWDGLQHIGVDESIYPISDTINGQQIWDVFHCNSVGLDQGGATQETANVVLSSRENSGVYLINRATGAVIWKVGGVRPSATDPDASAKYLAVTNDPETSFYAQHDARLSAKDELTLFDDHSGPPLYIDPHETPGPARGVQYKIDVAARTATLDWSHVAPDNESTLATGSFNRITDPAGLTDNVIGWGLNQTQTSGGVTTSKLFSDLNWHGIPTLEVDFLEPPGSSFPAVNGSYRVIKVDPSQLSLSLLRQNMGGLP